jgi:hypothetical protein
LFYIVSANTTAGIFRSRLFEDYGNLYIPVDLAVVATSELELLYDWRFTGKYFILAPALEAHDQRLFFCNGTLVFVVLM